MVYTLRVAGIVMFTTNNAVIVWTNNPHSYFGSKDFVLKEEATLG